MKPSKIKQKTLKQKNDETRTKLAHQVGIEPTYSNYSINVCLEGRWDTDALFGGQRKDRISKSRGARFTVWCASTYALSALILEEDVRIELTQPFGWQVSNLLQYHYANLPVIGGRSEIRTLMTISGRRFSRPLPYQFDEPSKTWCSSTDSNRNKLITSQP